MLAIRMQRTGRKGHAQFRVIVQDSRAHPKRGKVVAYAGSYNPHTKIAQLDSEKLGGYLEKGAQPSDRVARLLKREGIKLPSWVKLAPDKKRAPKKAKPETPVVTETAPAEVGEQAPVEAPADEPVTKEEKPAESEKDTQTPVLETTGDSEKTEQKEKNA